MSKNYVEMGIYYMDKTIGLVRTVSRMFDYKTNDPMVGFVKVGEGGVVSEMYAMPENVFKEKFIH